MRMSIMKMASPAKSIGVIQIGTLSFGPRKAMTYGTVTAVYRTRPRVSMSHAVRRLDMGRMSHFICSNSISSVR